MINFSSDYHLGSTLSTHTTPSSRIALKDAIFAQATKITDLREIGLPHYIGGDLVDTYRNDEAVIGQALQILSNVSNCIMGNHDVTNRKDSIGTMELLETLVEVVPAVMGKCDPTVEENEEAMITLVPHTNTQKLFEKCLNGLAGFSIKELDKGNWSNLEKKSILVLHCNYDHPWEMTETTLNLTPELAEKLLEVFDYILIGHEHNSVQHFDGRLIMMGNIHPTNFGDISDKYRWTLEEGKMHKHLIWEKEKHYAEIESFSEGTLGEDIQFVKITGKVDAAEYPNYCRSLSKLWKSNPHVFAIRSAVEIVNAAGTTELDTESLKNLTETIQEEIRGDKKMSELFEELLGEI